MAWLLHCFCAQGTPQTHRCQLKDATCCAFPDATAILSLASFRRVDLRNRGWLGAGLAETWSTLDIFRDEGVNYVCDWVSDDLPFRMSLDGGTMFSIPYSLQCNDTPQMFDQKLTSDEFGQLIRNQFDWLYKEAADIPRVMAIALHPFVSGHPNRIGAVDTALEYVCGHEGVWRATGSEIIDHYAKSVPDQ